MIGDQISFSAVVFEWRGPSPYQFVSIDGDNADWIRAQSATASYGWGMIPVECEIGTTTFTTSLWPKGDSYFLPLKVAVCRSEGLSIGDTIHARLSINRESRRK